MLFIQYFAKDGAEFGAVSANLLLKQKWVLGSSTGLKRDEFCCFSLSRIETTSSREPKGLYKQTRSMSDVSFQIAKKYKQQRDWKQEEKKKKERKEDIYEELWHFHCHLPLIFRLICFQGLWVSLRWRICIKSTWWFCHDLYLKPYPLNYTAVIWQKDDWINEGLLQYSWFEKLENNTSLCPQEIWLFH